MEQAGECHYTTYTNGMTSLLSIDLLPVEDVHLIIWQIGTIRKEKFHTICLHHNMVYLNKYIYPGTKLCPRCWSEIGGTLNNPKEYEDNVLRLNSPDGNFNPHLPEADQYDLDLELTQVLLKTNCKLLCVS